MKKTNSHVIGRQRRLAHRHRTGRPLGPGNSNYGGGVSDAEMLASLYSSKLTSPTTTPKDLVEGAKGGPAYTEEQERSARPSRFQRIREWIGRSLRRMPDKRTRALRHQDR